MNQGFQLGPRGKMILAALTVLSILAFVLIMVFRR